jgi:ABC-type molybdate transport system substrate-binding protein
MPVSFTPYLGWTDATDVNNIPTGFRLIAAADLLRYENYANDSKTLINSLETKVNALQAATTVATKTASYTLTATDQLVVANSATAITFTLPSAAASGAGKTFRVKNIGAGVLTVGSAAGTIDGAATATLAQWGRGLYVSDGTNWLVV